MSLPVPLNKRLNQSSNLHIAEDIAAHNRKTERFKRMINISLITLEYSLYTLTFFILFFYKVVSDYGPLSWSTFFSKIPVLDNYVLLIGIIFAIYTAMLYQKGMFKWTRDIRVFDDTVIAIKAVTISFLIALGFVFFLKTSVIYSRVLILILAVAMVLIFLICRIMRQYLHTILHRTQRYNKNVLIIGAGKVGMDIRNHIMNNTSARFIGFLDDYKEGDQIIGKNSDIEHLISHHKVQDIYITIPSEKNMINDLITKVRKYDVQIKIIPELFELVMSSISVDQAYDYPCIEIVKTPLRGLNLFLKRSADLLLSFIGIVMISPILLLVAIMIKLDSPGPIFIHQKRIGKNGATFYMHKFRSMVNNAEELKHQLERFNESDGPAFKIKNDPRITRIGKFIRKYSIDELPQLFNVLKGEMSLIGPRPPLPNEVELYNDTQWRRLDIRPGITGLWQVSGRSDISFDEWVKLDLYYIEKWSVSLELKILFKTVPVVLRGEGAY